MTPLEDKAYRAIQEKAYELGFSDAGFAPAEALTECREPLSIWLDNGLHAGMGYMENHFEKRLDPTLLVQGAQSVMVLLFNYFPEKSQPPHEPQIARYAYGADYHLVLKEKLNALFEYIRNHHYPALEGRVFTDSAPVLERAWAVKAGLGWLGKNSNLIHKRLGSYVLLSELVTNLPAPASADPVSEACGGCTRCIDACPTGALLGQGVLDARKCISYWTIEHKGDIPPEWEGKFGNRLFGCDICQEVCPWNWKARPHREPRFQPHPDLLLFTRPDWEALTAERFAGLFRHSAVKRAGYKGIVRNIRFLSQQP